MNINLREKPTNPVIIAGFLGVGLIGPISTEYLIHHLEAKLIGHISADNVAPVAAVHAGKLVRPLEVYYVKKKNLVILHAFLDVRGLEWDMASAILQVAKTLKAKELIMLEGIFNQAQEGVKPPQTINTFYFSLDQKKSKLLEKGKGTALKEGILMGISAALLLRDDTFPTTVILAETHSKLPDHRGAAKIIEVLDNYLGLQVDYQPLEKIAAATEEKLKSVLSKMRDTAKATEEKEVNYVG